MQHVICVKWTSDSKYILCGSDEMNIRLWKANASEKLGVVRPAFLSQLQNQVSISLNIMVKSFLKYLIRITPLSWKVSNKTRAHWYFFSYQSHLQGWGVC